MTLEEALRDAYRAGRYAADYDEGKVWRKRESDPPVEDPETEDRVVERLLAQPIEPR